MPRFATLFLAFAPWTLLAACAAEIEEVEDGEGEAEAEAEAEAESESEAEAEAESEAEGEGESERICGGRGVPPCREDEWCDYGADICGAADGAGVCRPRPDGCTEDCPGVCGCDGNGHCNACLAARAGVDVAPDDWCLVEEGEAEAESEGEDGCTMACVPNNCGNGCGIVLACGEEWPDGIVCPAVCTDLCECPPGWGIRPDRATCERCDCER